MQVTFVGNYKLYKRSIGIHSFHACIDLRFFLDNIFAQTIIEALVCVIWLDSSYQGISDLGASKNYVDKMRQVGGQQYVYDWSRDVLKYAEKCSKMSTQGGQVVKIVLNLVYVVFGQPLRLISKIIEAKGGHLVKK